MNAISKVLAPGIYDMAPETYHADPCPLPSFSHSVAKTLLTESPMHARQAHPRLRTIPVKEAPATSAMDFGSALHKLLLGKGADIEPIPFADYRKDAAKDRRDEARAFGRIPIIQDVMPELHATADAALAQMQNRADCDGFFAPGRSEAVIVWQAGETWCRSMVDRLPDDPTLPVYDIKSTEMSAAPQAWQRRMEQAYRMQDPFYARGLRAVRGVYPPAMRFVVVEMKPPYAVSVMACAPSLRAVAEADVDYALGIWQRCMRTGQWPGHPGLTAFVEASPWLLQQTGEREINHEILEEYAA